MAVLVGAQLPGQTELLVEEHLDELAFLAETAGARAERRFVQRLDRPDPRSFIRRGKLEEIRAYLERHPEVNLVIFDDDLSGKQVRHIQDVLKVKILDRSTLILDIFARRARTAQARKQVELAQLQYMLPRLRGMWTHLERQRGGIGMRGPGEKEIETDRRIVRDRIARLKRELKTIDRQSQTRRKNRGQLIRVALVGYTNAGKSTLFNLLTKANVLAEDKLFATLDATTRKVAWAGVPFLLADTVGFIRKLPHHLIESFKSTLDEVRESDILLHVVDVAHPQFETHIETVEKTLAELDAADKPTLLVLNKIDLYRARYFDKLLDKATKAELEAELLSRVARKHEKESLLLSAVTREHIPELREKLLDMVRRQYAVRYPYQTRRW